MDAEKLLKKPLENVQVATAEKPIENVQVATAEKPIVLSTEQRLDAMEKDISDIGKYLRDAHPILDFLGKQIAAQQNQTPTAAPNPVQGGGINELISIAKEAMKGEGQNSVLEEYGRQYMDLSGFVVKEVFKNIVPEAVQKMEAATAARLAAAP